MKRIKTKELRELRILRVIRTFSGYKRNNKQTNKITSQELIVIQVYTYKYIKIFY